MNTHLLKTRTESIQHYVDEIKKLNSAISVTKSTLDDIINSMTEFCDLVDDDLFIYNTQIYRFSKIESANIDSKHKVTFKVICSYQIRHYSEPKWEDCVLWMPLDDMVIIKSIGNVKNKQA